MYQVIYESDLKIAVHKCETKKDAIKKANEYKQLIKEVEHGNLWIKIFKNDKLRILKYKPKRK